MKLYKLALINVSALLIFGVTTSSLAYQIKPFLGVHEAMSLLAKECLRQRGNLGVSGIDGLNCGDLVSEIKNLSGTEKISLFTDSKNRLDHGYSDLERATRWPDDPTRQIARDTLLKYAVNAGKNCGRIVEKTTQIDQVGLLCSSHYGNLQFLHSMRSNSEENSQFTRSKIMDWAAFTYSVATGKIDSTKNYCKFWTERSSTISSIFAPKDFSYCEDRKRYKAWKVSTLFTMICDSPFSSATCNELIGLSSENISRIIATGALLHLIQDSYSQSHTVRGGNGEPPYLSKIECQLPTNFQDYTKQNGDEHGQADKIPVLADTCKKGALVDDAITASAKTLWHIQKKSDLDTFTKYMEQHVFGT